MILRFFRNFLLIKNIILANEKKTKTLMRKNYLGWFVLLTFLIIGCRNDNFNANETHNNQQALKFRLVSKDAIPEIMSSLQAKTNNFKVSLGSSSSAQGKVETAFGDVVTSYIIESTTENGEVYYTFPILPSSGNDTPAETYNLEVKADNAEMTTGKVLVYEPTAEWLANGNNDYATFSGNVSVYSMDGTPEGTVSYLTGTGNCNPEPCPDCPIQQGPGGGGGGNPGGGNGPTGTGGPVAYPGGGGGSGGGGGCGGWVFSHYSTYTGPSGTTVITGEVYINGCGQTMTIAYKTNFTANRAPASNCNQQSGGVIITIQNDPCTKTKNLLTNTSMQTSITELKNNATSGTGEMGFKATKAGAPTPMIPGGDHSLNFGDKTGYAGGYHNHTKKGIPMLSPADIDQLLGFARAQGNYGDPTQAFVGMVAPNGMHYIIRFEGTYQESTSFNFMDVDLKKKFNTYVELESNLKETLLYGTQYINTDGTINNKGVEKLLLETLKDMGLSSKVKLQRIDNNGTVQNINTDSNNQPIAVPCP